MLCISIHQPLHIHALTHFPQEQMMWLIAERAQFIQLVDSAVVSQQLYSMMRSQMQQQLFRALSNRTRTKPNQIYAKMTTQISGLQQQILHFNQLESQIPLWLKKETNKMGGTPQSLSLKMMTQPKYENLLADIELPQTEQSNLKNSKLMRKFSQRVTKQSKNPSFGSTAKSFKTLLGMRSKMQGSTSKPFWGSKADSRVKGRVESTMLQTLAQESIPVSNQNPKGRRQVNMSVTESIIFPDKVEETPQFSRSRPMSIRQQIIKKQKVLSNEWDKTERYHKKMSNWMGHEEAEKMVKTMCPNSRVVDVIQKIRSSRPSTCRLDSSNNRMRIKSQQL